MNKTKKRKIITVLFYFPFFLLGCNNHTPHKNVSVGSLYEDFCLYASQYYQRALLHSDTTELQKILQLSADVLKTDTFASHRYKMLYMRSTIYAQLRDNLNAMKEYEKALELLSPQHIDRLSYYGRKYMADGQTDSARIVLKKALEECDKQLSVEFDGNVFAKNYFILIDLDRETEAKDQLEEYLKNYTNDELLKALKEKGISGRQRGLY